jgi:uncharacterized protein YidB (DUF937 family)
MSGVLDDILGAAAGGKGGAGAIGDLLGGHQGGLGGLLDAFGKGGLGEIAGSWVGKGANLPISAEQIESVLGSGPIAEYARKMGIDPGQAAGVIAGVLPQVIDHLTPHGKAPEGGGLGALTGGLGDILGKLGR